MLEQQSEENHALVQKPRRASARREQNGLARARWLAELADALSGARDMLAQLDPAAAETAALADHIARAIGEVDLLRRGGEWPTGSKIGRKQTDLRGID